MCSAERKCSAQNADCPKDSAELSERGVPRAVLFQPSAVPLKMFAAPVRTLLALAPARHAAGFLRETPFAALYSINPGSSLPAHYLATRYLSAAALPQIFPSPLHPDVHRHAHCKCNAHALARSISTSSPPAPLPNKPLESIANESAEALHLKLRLDCGVLMIPHPDKAEKGGEDAYFVDEALGSVGVFDGVGGWASAGIDPALYSRALCSLSHVKLRTYGAHEVTRAVAEATREVRQVGSSTVCVVSIVNAERASGSRRLISDVSENDAISASVSKSDSTDEGVWEGGSRKHELMRGSALSASALLTGVNLGDSGVLVIRDSRVVFRSEEQQHFFNCPYQVGTDSRDSIERDAARISFPLELGDYVVLGTDGLLDNCFSSEIVDQIRALEIQARSQQKELPVSRVAEALAHLAFKHGVDSRRETPFAQHARQAGHKYKGGKLDDITVIVCRVIAAPQ
mmetsp:Transcript_15548/g.41826  ORF Transcript_15548/g.41826 Transcript_15548/m.41826 type:complete len:458 (+) Transcript_15548:123-1496(+)